jgi:hypothetical protein
MDDISAARIRSAKDEIQALARRHGVTYAPTPLDQLGKAMSQLAGDDMKLDDTEYLLLALERSGHLSTRDANRLHVAYMRQHRL